MYYRFAAANLNPQPDVSNYDKLVEQLAADDTARSSFLKACLRKLGLEISVQDSGVPSLSSLHLSSVNNTEVGELLSSMQDIIEKESGQEYIRSEVDTFHIQDEDTVWNVDSLHQPLPSTVIDYSKVIKKIVPHEKALPPHKLTPRFNHSIYFSSLKRYRQVEEGEAEDWGNLLMYGEVVTSTNTLLDKYAFLSRSA